MGEFLSTLGKVYDHTHDLFGVWGWVWFVELVAMLGLSFYSHLKASRGAVWWSRFALLPVFHYAIIFRKSQILVFWILTFLCDQFAPDSELKAHLTWATIITNFTSYTWAYTPVLVFLMAKSGGTKTMKRAFVITLIPLCVDVGLTWGECTNAASLESYMSAEAYDRCEHCQGLSGGWSTFKFWPDAYGPNDEYCEFVFSQFIRLSMLTLTVIGLVTWYLMGRGAPRRPRLLLCGFIGIVGAYGILAPLFFVNCTGEANCAKYQPMKWFGMLMCVETVICYVIMLFESWHWGTLALGPASDLSHQAIDHTCKQPFLQSLAVGLQDLQQNPWSRVPNIPASCVSLESTPFAQTASVSVHKGVFMGSAAAFKQILCEEITPEDIRFMCRELKISTQLKHPNIVNTHGFVISPPYVSVCMELCQASLYDLLYKSEEQLTLGQARNMAQDIATGVAYMHSHSVLHRDLKSLNVLTVAVPGGWTCKVCDFGESIMDPNLEVEEEELVGTSIWSAPEILSRPRDYSEFSDVYALALVTFECFTRTQFWLLDTSTQAEFLRSEAFDTLLTMSMDVCADPSFEDMMIVGWRPTCEKGVLKTPDAVLRAWSQRDFERASAQELVEALEQCKFSDKTLIPCEGFPVRMVAPTDPLLKLEALRRVSMLSSSTRSLGSLPRGRASKLSELEDIGPEGW